MATPLRGLAQQRAAGIPSVMLTAYDYPSALIAEAAGVDIVLVGDSAAMTVLGYSNTRDITIDELLMLVRAVRRAVREIPVVGDLPYGTYEDSDAQAVATALRFTSEGGCDAVKLEGGGLMVSRVRAIVAAGIAVIGHVGLLPQSVVSRDGYRARGRDVEQALGILDDSSALELAGCAALVVEAVPAELGAMITARVGIPVIGIGAGAATSGQVLVYHDLLGFTRGHLPKFVRTYATAHDDMVSAVRRWASDVRTGVFPAAEHTYAIAPEVLALVKERLR